MTRREPAASLRSEFPEYYAGLRLRRLRIALVAVAFLVVGLMGWLGAELGGRLGPAVHQLEIRKIDNEAERPERPALPDPPFVRPA